MLGIVIGIRIDWDRVVWVHRVEGVRFSWVRGVRIGGVRRPRLGQFRSVCLVWVRGV